MKSLAQYIKESKNGNTTIAFIEVSNSAKLERHSMDGMYDDVDAVVQELSKLKPSEYELIGWKGDADYDADVFNDWDDDVRDTMEWDEKEYNKNVKQYGKLTGHKDFDKWVVNYWAVAIPASVEEIKSKLK